MGVGRQEHATLLKFGEGSSIYDNVLVLRGARLDAITIIYQ